MKIKYSQDTDTLYIELRRGETKNLDKNTLLDLDEDGRLCTITTEHASQRLGAPSFSYEQFSA